MGRGLKAEGLASACDKLKMNELSKNLFLALAENGRFNVAEAVVNSFSTIMAAHRGEVVCEIVTAKALDANMKKEVDCPRWIFAKGTEKPRELQSGPLYHWRN